MRYEVAEEISKMLEFNSFRSFLVCLEYLLLEQACVADMLYCPSRQYNERGEKMSMELHTTDWWREVQVNHIIPTWSMLLDCSS